MESRMSLVLHVFTIWLCTPDNPDP
jgi:hypothetical protein